MHCSSRDTYILKEVEFAHLQSVWHLPEWWRIHFHQQSENSRVETFFASVQMGTWVKWTDHKIIRNRSIMSRTHFLSAVKPQQWREHSHMCALMKCDRHLETKGWHLLTASPSAHWKLLASGHHNLLRTVYYCTSKLQVTQILGFYGINSVCSPVTSARIVILNLPMCSLAACLTFQITKILAS